MPGYDWEAEKRDFWNGRADVAMGMLPLTLLGLGRASLKDIHGAQEMLAQDQVLARAGIPEADRRAIVEKAQSGQGPEALAALQEAWGRRDPATAAGHQKLMSSQEAHVEQVYNEAMERGLMPEVTPTEDGHLTVKDSTGTEAKFTTRQQALNAASQVMTEAQQAEVAAMLAAAVDGSGSTGSPAPAAIPVEASPSNPGPIQDQQRPKELDLARVYAEAQVQGIVPPIHEQDGKFIVTDSEGTPATFTNREEAVEAAIVFMTPQQRQKVQAMVEQKQKAGVNNTAPVDKQTVTATVGGDPPQNLDGDTGQAEAETSASTTETGTAPARTSMPQANPQTAPQGAIPPAQPSQPANTPPPLWQGSIGRDAQGQDKTVVIRKRNPDGSYQVQTPEGQSIRLSPEAYESMTGAKPEPSATAPDPAGKPSDEAESGPLWHVPIRETHELPQLPYDLNRKPSGPRKTLSKKDANADNIRGNEGENEVADVMARYGYTTEQVKEKKSSPDFKINDSNEKWEAYSPSASTPLKNILANARDKIWRQKAPYFLIRLDPDGPTIADIKDHFRDKEIPSEKQIFVIKSGQLHIIR